MRSPEHEPPRELLKDYTLDGKIKIEHWWFPPMADPDPSLCASYTYEKIEELRARAARGGLGNYPESDPWIHDAMREFVPGKEVLVVGSTHPWYEAMSLAHGCRSCTVVEYHLRPNLHPSVRYVTVADLQRLAREDGRRFDVIVSISSIEHDGLGRYGDPLDPWADVCDMRDTHGYLADDGVVLLAVPVGRDKVVWNAHRIYGPVRLPMLLDGYDTERLYGLSGLDDPRVDEDTHIHAGFQPLFVVKKGRA